MALNLLFEKAHNYILVEIMTHCLLSLCRGQGVRNIMSSQARKDSTEYHNNSYMLAPDEVGPPSGPAVVTDTLQWAVSVDS